MSHSRYLSMHTFTNSRTINLSRREVKRRIQELRSLDLNRDGVTVDQLRSRLLVLLEHYACRTIFLEPHVKIFRARKKPESKGEGLFANRKELWYPEPKYVKRLGRLNKIGQPLFYCASNSDTAIFEIRPDIGDIVTVLECETIAGASPFLISVDVYEQLARLGVKLAGDVSLDPLLELRKSVGREWHKNRMIEEFISAEFKKNVEDGHECEYKLSIAIAELLFSFGLDAKGVDGIAFPSTRSGLIDINIALLPRAVDRMYRPIACQAGKIVGYSSDGMPIWKAGFSKSIHKFGRIEWDLKTSASVATP